MKIVTDISQTYKTPTFRYLKWYFIIYTDHLTIGKLLIIGIRESILP